MSIFDDMLKSDESLFLDEVALDYSFIPKLIPYREQEQKRIAFCIKPLFSKRNGKNVFMYGPPGIGKTVAIKHIFRELEDKTEDILPIYINCWQKNTSFKIAIEMCEKLGYSFTHNKKTDDLMDIIINIVNKNSAVFCFDEIDKVEDLDFLYTLLEKIYRKTIILITNYKSWIMDLDERIKSRLTLEFLEFGKYNFKETKGILKNRLKYAFVSGVWEDDAFNKVAQKTYDLGDIRSGLYMLREAGNAAEDKASRKITIKHVDTAIKKLNEFNIKKSTDLKDNERDILKIVKENSGKKIGDLFKIYKKQGGKYSYKSFQRKINHLGKNKFISIDKRTGGEKGNTSIIKYSQKKLDEY
ncbi:AAA family ATPase [Candidatus Woesearchaeota archaeon]|nr:AAA family ATPase [Candidatus Woesearchaeota archaeon]